MCTRLNRLSEAVLTSTCNPCFEQKYEAYEIFLSENFPFWVVKCSIYLNRHVFVMASSDSGHRCPHMQNTLWLIYSTLSVLDKTFSRRHFDIFFIYIFPSKLVFDISFKLSPREMSEYVFEGR